MNAQANSCPSCHSWLENSRSENASVGSQSASPLVSVVVPVYKVEKYLRECVESVLAQTFTDFELILVDDGSPDNSGAICDEFAARDSRVRVFHKENGGVSSARNLGVAHARGEWISFVDSDDKLFPDALASLFAGLRDDENPDEIDLVEGDVSRDFENPDPLANASVARVNNTAYAEAVARAGIGKTMTWIAGPVAKIFRKRTFMEADALNVPAEIWFGEDLIANLKFARKMRVAKRIPAVVYFYRRNEQGACLGRKRTAAYLLHYLATLETVLPGGISGAWRKVWILYARHSFVAMSMLDDWDSRDADARKIVAELSRERGLSVGTRLCLFAAKLPHFVQPLARRFLRMALRAKLASGTR